MERVLPSAGIKERLAALAVGLAADCDAPTEGIDALLHQHLPNAQMLPFLGFLTPDGTWIDGAAGSMQGPAFAQLLEAVAKSPLLDATPAVRKQLEKSAAAATSAAAKADWKAVLAAARAAAKSTGRCPERTAIATAERQARDWAQAQLTAVVQAARTGGDLTPVKKQLADVKAQFAGEPEADEAEQGRKALQRLTIIREVEATGGSAQESRAKAAATFANSRWALIFEKPVAAPADQRGK